MCPIEMAVVVPIFQKPSGMSVSLHLLSGHEPIGDAVLLQGPRGSGCVYKLYMFSLLSEKVWMFLAEYIDTNFGKLCLTFTEFLLPMNK